MTRRKIILDTDPGVGIPGTDADDPIAILLALAHPDLQLLGVTTTFGNSPSSLTARGASAVLDAAGRPDVPVAAGRSEPLAGQLPEQLATAYAGARGRPGRIALPELTDRSTTAEQLIIDTVRANPGEVTVVCIGPQTNLAAALALDPALASQLHSVVFMGGALGIEPTYGHGNITPLAECNIYFDPEAADQVLRSGTPLTMVGLDVTNPATGLVLTEDDIRTVERHWSPAAAMFRDVCDTYIEAPMFDWGHGCVLYDPLAVLAAAEPDVGTFRSMGLAIDTGTTATRGRTTTQDRSGVPVEVMVDVDGRAAVNRILTLIRDLVAGH